MDFPAKNETMILFCRKNFYVHVIGKMLFLYLYPNQEVKISMEKLLAVIYDSNQRTINEWIIKEG